MGRDCLHLRAGAWKATGGNSDLGRDVRLRKQYVIDPILSQLTYLVVQGAFWNYDTDNFKMVQISSEGTTAAGFMHISFL